MSPNRRKFIDQLEIAILVTLLIAIIVGIWYVFYQYSPISEKVSATKQVPITHYELVAGQTNEGVKGSISGGIYGLCIGQINGEVSSHAYIYVYRKNNFGNIIIEKFNYDDVEFCYTSSSETPYMETVEYHRIIEYTYKDNRTIQWEEYLDKYNKWVHYKNITRNTVTEINHELTLKKTIIHIPEGSIHMQYDMNIK